MSSTPPDVPVFFVVLNLNGLREQYIGLMEYLDGVGSEVMPNVWGFTDDAKMAAKHDGEISNRLLGGLGHQADAYLFVGPAYGYAIFPVLKGRQ